MRLKYFRSTIKRKNFDSSFVLCSLIRTFARETEYFTT